MCFFQVTDLRLALQRAEQQQARKEDYLREEISDLQQVTKHARQQRFIQNKINNTKRQYKHHSLARHLLQRVQEAETRNQELNQSVTSATRPLLRQIENLQASLGGQTASWEKLEKNISDRLGERLDGFH